MNLTHKRVIVTGGAQGIGRAIAEFMRSAGAVVVIADKAFEKAQATAAELPGTIAMEVDVAEEASVIRMVDHTAARLGGLDVVVNCAGVLIMGIELTDMSLSDWRRVIDINLTGTFLCCREAARVIAPNTGGSIINIASSTALKANRAYTAYSASKAAVAHFTRCAAVDLAPRGIRVNAIAPGPVVSPMTQQFHSEKMQQVARTIIPLGRYGTPREIAGAATFLASDEASYITGEVLVVDGGMTPAGLIVKTA